jgi:DNA topoisomerase I
MARLRRSNCAAPGIARRGRGRGFEYRDPAGDRIDDREVLERIAQLAIPPAWKEVWICIDPLGHLQATGMDAAGRKQYLYHQRWRAHRDRLKFDSMVAFGEVLPRLRRHVIRDLSYAGPAPLRLDDLDRERVLACSVRLLDLGFFRIGSEDYAERNESYGLTTVLRDHVRILDSEVVFDFPAKSGQRRVQGITDNDALTVVAALKRRRSGSQLLAYREANGWVEVRAEDVNGYIKHYTAGDFTAKDFRTWHATVLAAVGLAVSQGAESPTARKRAITRVVQEVADYLGNTPAVARASYIDPRVITRYEEGITIASSLADLGKGQEFGDVATKGHAERAVLKLLSADLAKRGGGLKSSSAGS